LPLLLNVQAYATAPLQQLSAWIDAQRSGPPPSTTALANMQARASAAGLRAADPSASSPPASTLAPAGRGGAAAVSTSPLALFLASLGAADLPYEAALTSLLPRAARGAAHEADEDEEVAGEAPGVQGLLTPPPCGLANDTSVVAAVRMGRRSLYLCCSLMRRR
jgi:hypothetical protein